MHLPHHVSVFLRRKSVWVFTASDLILLGILLTLLVLNISYQERLKMTTAKQTHTANLLVKTGKELESMKHENQFVINQKQKAEIEHIHTTYAKTVTTYEALADFKLSAKDTKQYDEELATTMKELSEQNYASADATLTILNKQLADETAKVQAAAATVGATKIPTVNGAPAPANNNAPGSGLSRQQVQTDGSSFVVDIIAGDLNSTRVLVDTASDGDCSNSCPALPLGTYAARSGAYAAINGSYFCPPEYPSCAGKTNSSDTLIMNKNKKYFNSDNNVYSTVPLVAFTGNSAIFKGQSSQWGRDTGVDAVIAMQPGLIFGGSVAYSDSSDPKYNSRGARNFIANKGSTAYIGTIHNATMGESAKVLKAMGMENAINLDEGGSTALWYNGSYINGPGRNIPNAVLFVRK